MVLAQDLECVIKAASNFSLVFSVLFLFFSTKQAEREREIKRREQGKQVAAAKQQWKETQMKKEAQERLKEKAEAQAARLEIKERLAREKAARLAARQTPPAQQVPSTETKAGIAFMLENNLCSHPGI